MFFSFFLATLVNKKVARPRRNTKISQPRTFNPTKKSLINERIDWNDSLPPFKGTGELYKKENQIELGVEYDDEEWTNDSNKGKVPVKFKNSLGALMSAYMSDDDEDDGPLEEKIQKAVLLEESIDEEKEKPEIKSKRKRNQRRGKKKIGKIEEKNITEKVLTPRFKKRPVTLLEKLLDSEIRHERNILLQCVKHVVNNDFFKNNK